MTITQGLWDVTYLGNSEGTIQVSALILILNWLVQLPVPAIRNCSNTEDMEAYTRILTNFLMNKEYYDTECKIPNCEKSQWKVEEFFHDFELSFLEEKQGKVYLLHLDKNVSLKVYEYEVPIADFLY